MKGKCGCFCVFIVKSAQKTTPKFGVLTTKVVLSQLLLLLFVKCGHRQGIVCAVSYNQKIK
jgi:hypothetical protein